MFFSQNGEDQLIAIFEVQSSVVRGSLARFRGTAQPAMLAFIEQAIAFEPGMETGRLVKETTDAVTTASAELLKRLSLLASEHPEERLPARLSGIHFALSTPWIVCQARTLKVGFDKPAKATANLVASLVEKERPRGPDGGDAPTAVVEEQIFDVRLNGYSVASWRDKETRQIEVSYALGVVGTGAISRLEEAVSAMSRGRACVFFHSALLLHYLGARILLPKRDSYMLIHPHGELTDAVVVDRGSCVFFGSYPSGIRSAIRAVAAQNSTDIETARSFMALYAEKRLSAAETATAELFMKKLGLEWAGQLKRLLDQGLDGRAVPDHALIASHLYEGYFADALTALYPMMAAEQFPLEEAQRRLAFAPGTEDSLLSGMYALAIHSLAQNAAPVR